MVLVEDFSGEEVMHELHTIIVSLCNTIPFPGPIRSLAEFLMIHCFSSTTFFTNSSRFFSV